MELFKCDAAIFDGYETYILIFSDEILSIVMDLSPEHFALSSPAYQLLIA